MDTFTNFISENTWGLALVSFFAIICLAIIWYVLGKLVKLAIILSAIAVIGYTVLFYMYGEGINSEIVGRFRSTEKAVVGTVMDKGGDMILQKYKESAAGEPEENTDDNLNLQ